MDLVQSLLEVALFGSTWVLWLLLALSVVSFAAIVERVAFFRRNRRGAETFAAAVRAALATSDVAAVDRALAEGGGSVEADALRQAWRFRAGGPDALVDGLEGALGRARRGLERGLTLLGTLGNNAPFIGLFGTVLGVIEAFYHLADGQNDAAMGNVMAGISEALVATGVGIFVALPAVVAFNVAQQKVAEIESDARALARSLSAWLRAGGVGIGVGATTSETRAAARAASDHELSIAAAVPGGE